MCILTMYGGRSVWRSSTSYMGRSPLYSNKAYDVSPYSRLWRRTWKITSRCLWRAHGRFQLYMHGWLCTHSAHCLFWWFHIDRKVTSHKPILYSDRCGHLMHCPWIHSCGLECGHIDVHDNVCDQRENCRKDPQHSPRGRSPAPRGSPKFFDPPWPFPAMFNSEEHVHDSKIDYTTLFTCWCMTKMHFQNRDEHYI